MKNVIIFFFYLSEAPLIYLSLGGKYFIEGSPVTVACTASGKPPPDVAWIRNGVLESSGKKAASLKFHNINRKDAGQYTCRANNSVDVTSIDTKIVVYCKYILTLIFYFWIYFIYSATPVNEVQVHKTDESVQNCKETEFHLNPFRLCMRWFQVLVGTIESRWNHWLHHFASEDVTIALATHCTTKTCV